MGRTLHYKITKLDGKPFTMDEHRTLYDLSKRYNSGHFEHIWSCENFFPSPFGSYCPNWQHPDLKYISPEAAYKVLEIEMERAKGRDKIEKVLTLAKKKMIQLFYEMDSDTIGGFTKTQGNELNSLLVLMGLVEVSELLPVRITLSDEGRLLYCPLMIQKGRAIPMIDKLIEHFEWLAARHALSVMHRRGLSKKLKFDGMDSVLKNALKLDNPYNPKRDAEYMQNDLDDLAHLQKVLASKGIKGYDIKRLEERPVHKWLPVNLLHRNVNAADYVDYQMSAATIMDGFHGEGFGLTKDTAEATSYRSIGMIQKLLGLVGTQGAHLQVLGVKEPVAPLPPKKKRAPRKKKPIDAGNWAINHLAEG